MHYSFSPNCVCSARLGSCEQALLPPSLVCGSEGAVSHQGAAVSSSYLSRLQIILEYAWEKVKKEVKVLELQLGSLSFSSRKGRKKKRKKKRNRHTHVNPKQPTVRKFPFAQDTFYIFGKDFIWFWLNNYRVFSWESFNVKLDGKPELSSVFNFSKPRFPVIVSKQATIVLPLTESRS